MQIGIGLPNQVRNVRPAVIPAWAARAEEAGFATVATVGRFAYPGVMDTVALAAAATATSTIGLLSCVLIGPAWPPLLLAKEVAGIDGLSGGRLTLGLGLGVRPDDFVVDGLGLQDRGARLDHDLEIYRDVWRGEITGGANPTVPAGTREVPILFGGFVPAAFERVARWGTGYIGAVQPPEMAAQAFQEVRAAWDKAGRAGSPRLVAIAYYALGGADKGRAGIRDYYSASGSELADTVTASMYDSPEQLNAAVAGFAEIGADDLIFLPALDDPDEVTRLADTVLQS